MSNTLLSSSFYFQIVFPYFISLRIIIHKLQGFISCRIQEVLQLNLLEREKIEGTSGCLRLPFPTSWTAKLYVGCLGKWLQEKYPVWTLARHSLTANYTHNDIIYHILETECELEKSTIRYRTALGKVTTQLQHNCNNIKIP